MNTRFSFSFTMVQLLAAVSVFAACGVTVSNGGSGAGGEGGRETTPTSTPWTTTDPTSSSSSSSGAMSCPASTPLSGPCAPVPACSGAGSECLAEVDQSNAATYAFRMAQITYAKPDAFSDGLIKSVLSAAELPNDPACHLPGNGTVSWLLRFDPAAGTLTTGGSKPVPSPSGPYSFVAETVQSGALSLSLAPVVLSSPLQPGCLFSSSAGDLVFPMYVDLSASQLIPLPLRQVAFKGGLSAGYGCIGRYNAEGLDPVAGCLPDSTHSPFVDGAGFSGYINLEEADQVTVDVLSMSLCLVLAGESSANGSGESPINRCKRTSSGAIVFQGDWCAKTNQPASAGCADALQVSATFAAQAVKIQ